MENKPVVVRLRYDGKYDWIEAPHNRQWTIVGDFVDAQGRNRNGGSFSLKGLKELGIVNESF